MIIPDVIIHTGNLLKNQHAKRYFSKNALSTAGHKNKELENALENKVFKLTENGSWSHLKTTDCPDDESTDKNFLSVQLEENEISISTKIFISVDSKAAVVKQAVNQLEQKVSLGKRFKINILILSFPRNYETVKMVEFYKTAKQLVKSGLVCHVGIADLCLGQLETLEKESVEPDVIQIDYTSHGHDCNSSLVKYAVKRDMLTLIHTDCTPFITSEKINEITGSEDVNAVDAVIRYAITAKTRSVLLAKGYFLFLEKVKNDQQ